MNGLEYFVPVEQLRQKVLDWVESIGFVPHPFKPGFFIGERFPQWSLQVSSFVIFLYRRDAVSEHSGPYSAYRSNALALLLRVMKTCSPVQSVEFAQMLLDDEIEFDGD